MSMPISEPPQRQRTLADDIWDVITFVAWTIIFWMLAEALLKWCHKPLRGKVFGFLRLVGIVGAILGLLYWANVHWFSN